ncbi:MAG: 3-oxo-tetronate kinase, partial [Pseudomonadota bacterium]
LDWLKAAGAQRFFWKYCSTFDSTQEGNIGPVAEALMEALGTDQTIYCPAFPENGRSIFMGTLFVGQQPLAESPMKDHPLTPMRDSNLMRLLAPQVTRPVGLADRLVVAQGADALRAKLSALKEAGTAHVVVDAVANSDLEIIAQACRDIPLMTGGSAVAMPLPALYVADGTLAADAPKATAPDLPQGAVLLSGSASSMTNAQVGEYRAKAPSFQLDPMVLAAEGPKAALAWLSDQPLDAQPLIYATAQPEEVKAAQDKLGVAQAGELVETALATLAVAARDRGVRRFVVAGGETSGAVTKALGVTRLDIGAEIAPGVPWTYCESAGHQIALTLKSGNFGAETFFTDALQAL